jgi:putative membrane protein
MAVAAQILIALVALLHLWFLTLEMFLWRGPIGRKTFGNSQQRADDTAVLAANQGLYNGFLAAGLVWSLLASDPLARPLRLFFLGCVLVAGLYGAATASRKILFVQALPGAVALAAVLLS